MPLFLVIFLLIYINLFIKKKKSDNTDKNKCTAEDDNTACIESCSGGRKLINGECKCNLGTYDDGVNNLCITCHYSW